MKIKSLHEEAFIKALELSIKTLESMTKDLDVAERTGNQQLKKYVYSNFPKLFEVLHKSSEEFREKNIIEDREGDEI